MQFRERGWSSFFYSSSWRVTLGVRRRNGMKGAEIAEGLQEWAFLLFCTVLYCTTSYLTYDCANRG